MRQSLAEFEEAFREEAAESIVRRERLRKQAVQRSRVRRVERRRQAGKLRFTLLALTIVITAVVVTIVMFETLAMLAARPLAPALEPRSALHHPRTSSLPSSSVAVRSCWISR